MTRSPRPGVPLPLCARSNDFGKQPDDPAAVKAAVAEAGLNCRIMQFAHVAGPDIHPLYNFLRVRGRATAGELCSTALARSQQCRQPH